jgi:hypothetical protein
MKYPSDNLLDMLRATEYLLADRLGLRPLAARALSMFSGVRIILTLPSGIFFIAEAVVRNFSTHFLMVLRSGPVPCPPMLKCQPNIRCVRITESLFLKTSVRRTHSLQQITDPCLLNSVPS